MERGIQEVIQVFCSICSRGVLVRNESMYKCKQCGLEVCRSCFDKEHRLCVECVRQKAPEAPNKMERIKALQQDRDEKSELDKKTQITVMILGFALFGGVLLLSVVIYIPEWVVLAVAVLGLYLGIRNILNLLKN